jgi:arylformamidase
MKRIIDISPPLSPETAVYPGDTPLSRHVALDMKSGDILTLSSITTTLHVGAHTDAPSHYAKDGDSIEKRPLDRYIGDCQVIHVDVGPRERIQPSHLTVPITAARVLFRTNTFPNPNHFSEDFAALSPALITHLAAHDVVLVGIDTPSVDLSDDKVLASHTAIYASDIAILEGIVLSDVPEGHYTLVALPLPIVGADASPVRAVLLCD